MFHIEENREGTDSLYFVITDSNTVDSKWSTKLKASLRMKFLNGNSDIHLNEILRGIED